MNTLACVIYAVQNGSARLIGGGDCRIAGSLDRWIAGSLDRWIAKAFRFIYGLALNKQRATSLNPVAVAGPFAATGVIIYT